MATLINGNGNPAIYAQQDADLYNGIMGPRTRILNVGSKMAATIEDANTIAIADGVIITKEGRRVQVDVGNVDEFIIPTGQAGTTRYYIIGYHLYTDGSANQLCETFVQLMADGSETIPEDEFREGATEVYVSLYRIEQTGLTLNDPEALLTVGDSVSQIEDDIDDIEGDIAQINSDLTELDERTTRDVVYYGSLSTGQWHDTGYVLQPNSGALLSITVVGVVMFEKYVNESTVGSSLSTINHPLLIHGSTTDSAPSIYMATQNGRLHVYIGTSVANNNATIYVNRIPIKIGS